MSDKVTLKIPRQLYDKLKTIINETGYSSVTEFVVCVLRDLVSSEEFAVKEEKIKKNEIAELTEEEVMAIKKRLRNLGYME
ncbi:MAG: CopG family transcriptional regulator [Thermotogota bacterium]|nr:CopG family transcriptional regulator [Thermotogota bacterium]